MADPVVESDFALRTARALLRARRESMRPLEVAIALHFGEEPGTPLVYQFVLLASVAVLLCFDSFHAIFAILFKESEPLVSFPRLVPREPRSAHFAVKVEEVLSA